MSEEMNPPEDETPRITTIRNQWKLDSKEKAKFRVVDGKVESSPAPPPAQDLEATVAAARAAEKRTRQEIYAAKMGNARPGDRVKGSGVFIGKFTLKDKDGSGLSKTFNIFAAPEDMKDSNGKNTMTYRAAARCVSQLENWHGHDGAACTTEKEILQALADGGYAGGWIIPPREILDGRDSRGRVVQPDNLYDCRAKGVLEGTFITAVTTGADHPGWYWSSTQDGQGQHWNVKFWDRLGAWNTPDVVQTSCRPVRLELVP